MPGYIGVWVSFGMLLPMLLAVDATECLEKERLIKPIPSTWKQPSECLMECTGMTFIKKLQLQDNHNIRLSDSKEGDLGEYCWPTEIKCNVGERFLHAYVVLPVDISAAGHDQLEVKATAPAVTPLHSHSSPTTIAESCGLRYEVTRHFSTQNPGTSFCVRVATQEDPLGDTVLRCPPYLVTFWQRSPNQHQQQGIQYERIVKKTMAGKFKNHKQSDYRARETYLRSYDDE